MVQDKKKKKHQPKGNSVKKEATQVTKSAGSNHYIALLIILIITFVAYLPVLHNGFVNWDDDKYIQSNPLIYSLNLKQLFTQYAQGNYHPFTMLTYALEYHFWGMNETGYHLVNLAIHLLNVALVFRVALLLSGKAEVGLVTAFLFAIHPMHVESVAWASELKDLLYTFFFLASYIFYLQYLKDKKSKFYLYALLLFLCSLFSKAMAVSLPVVLLLTDYYKGRKMDAKIWIEKAPFLALAVVFGVVAIMAQKSLGAIQDITVYPFYLRVIFACFAFISYLFKLFLPLQLSAYYPYPIDVGEALPSFYYIYPVLFIALAAGVIYSLRRSKLIAFGIGFFAITIFLVLQLLPVGDAVMADRYNYIPSIGIFYLVAEGLYLLWNRKAPSSSFKIPAAIVLSVFLIFFSFKTYGRCEIWKNSLNLWNDVISHYKGIPLAYNNRGLLLVDEKRYDEALQDYNKCIELQPDFALAYNDRGVLYKKTKKYDEALNDFNKAIALKPDFYQAYINVGTMLVDQKKYDEALPYYLKGIELKPDYALAYYFRGFLFAVQNKNAEALSDYEKVIELQPNNGEAYFNKAILEHNMGKKEECCRDLQDAINHDWQPAANALHDLCH